MQLQDVHFIINIARYIVKVGLHNLFSNNLYNGHHVQEKKGPRLGVNTFAPNALLPGHSGRFQI